MTKMNLFVALSVSLLSCFSLKSQTLKAGDIAVIGFNADSLDNLAIVTFAPIPANTILYIRDDEWNGTAFNTGEGILSWNSGSNPITVGTVILWNNLADSATRAANIGTFTKISTTSFDLATTTGDAVFIYTGTSHTTPTSFLAAAMNNTVETVGTKLDGTGLIENETALVLPTSVDIGAYKGARTGFTKDGFLNEISRTTNWDTQDATGNQSTDGISPDIPFATTPFVISATDNVPPSVFSVTLENPTTFKIGFTEKITQVTAENKANYVLTPSLPIQSVVYNAVSKTAILTTNPVSSGIKYKLTANGFIDLAGNIQTTAKVFDSFIFNSYAGTDLIISEIMYNLGGDTLEFVEIYNRGTTPIPIGGMKLVGLTGTLPEYPLAAKEAVVLASDSAKFRNFYGVKAIYDWESGVLSNSGQNVGLKNSLEAVVDSVLYDDASPWDSLPDGRGASLEIIDPDKDNGVATNWRGSKTPLNKKLGTLNVFCSPNKLGVALSLKTIPKEMDFTIFPNPSANELYFNRDISGILIDNMGRVVLKFEKQTRLDIQRFPNGLYIVKTKEGVEKKVIIQK
jgi:hypothetical protein